MSAERDEARESPASRRRHRRDHGRILIFVVAAAIGLSFSIGRLRATPRSSRSRISSPGSRPRDGLRDPEIARQQADLQRFRWIDRAHGVFQIPIERAMRLVAAPGARAYEPVAPANGGLAEQPKDGSTQ